MMEQNLGIIYIATNLVNGKQYVGQTTKVVKERIKQHKNNKRGNYPFHKAIKKYGIENLKLISFSCPEEDLDWQEIFLIKELNTLVPNGYNLETGGNKNKHHHELTKKKIRENMPNQEGRNNSNYGNHKLAGKNNPNYGVACTEEKRKKMQKPHHSIQGERHWRAKNVILISPEGVVFELCSYLSFCKGHNLNASHMCAIFRGKLKQHKGWTGRYLEEKNVDK